MTVQMKNKTKMQMQTRTKTIVTKSSKTRIMTYYAPPSTELVPRVVLEALLVVLLLLCCSITFATLNGTSILRTVEATTPTLSASASASTVVAAAAAAAAAGGGGGAAPTQTTPEYGGSSTASSSSAIRRRRNNESRRRRRRMEKRRSSTSSQTSRPKQQGMVESVVDEEQQVQKDQGQDENENEDEDQVQAEYFGALFRDLQQASSMPPTPSPPPPPTTAPPTDPTVPPCQEGTLLDLICDSNGVGVENNNTNGPQNISQDLTTLCQLLIDTGLSTIFDDPSQSLTIFAPTDEAFDLLLPQVELTQQPIFELLLYHTLNNQILLASQLVCDSQIAMANELLTTTKCRFTGLDKPLYFQVGSGNTSNNNLPQIVGTDFMTCNGVLHLVDHVILSDDIVVVPPSTPSPTTSVPIVMTAAPTTTTAGPVPAPTPTPTPTPVPVPITPSPTTVTTAPVVVSARPTTIAPTTAAPTTAVPTTESPTAAPSSTSSCDGFTPTQREALINIYVRQISSPDDVSTQGSPQYLATQWLIEEDLRRLCPNDPTLMERYVMAVFYYSTLGNRWNECGATSSEEECTIEVQPLPCTTTGGTNNNCNSTISGSDTWLSEASTCTWGGLACDSTTFNVVQIQMAQNGVGGTLATELSYLSSLRALSLQEGILTGTIPSQYGLLQNLERLDLDFNLLGGLLPTELYELTSLQELDLNDNEFSGPIATEMGQLTDMKFLQIQNNFFSGTVPTELGLLNELAIATFDNNRLEGVMPCPLLNQTGNLEILASDCLGAPNRPSPPFVICECCTRCF